VKLIFSVLNGLLVFGSIAFIVLAAQGGDIRSFIIPSILTVIFIANSITIWKPLNIWFSTIQALLTLLTILPLYIIYVIAIPLAIAVLSALEPNLDKELLLQHFNQKGDIIMNSVFVMIVLSALYTVYNAFQNKKLSN